MSSIDDIRYAMSREDLYTALDVANRTVREQQEAMTVDAAEYYRRTQRLQLVADAAQVLKFENAALRKEAGQIRVLLEAKSADIVCTLLEGTAEFSSAIADPENVWLEAHSADYPKGDVPMQGVILDDALDDRLMHTLARWIVGIAFGERAQWVEREALPFDPPDREVTESER